MVIAARQHALTQLGRVADIQQAVIAAARGHREFNPGWHTCVDLDNLLTVSEAVARSALERTESRGAHFRDDHPGKEADWGHWNLVIRKSADGSMQIERKRIPDLPDELKSIIEEMK